CSQSASTVCRRVRNSTLPLASIFFWLVPSRRSARRKIASRSLKSVIDCGGLSGGGSSVCEGFNRGTGVPDSSLALCAAAAPQAVAKKTRQKNPGQRDIGGSTRGGC